MNEKGAVATPAATKPDTKDRILDAAERLFAEFGFPATSLRQITTGADANLAAVNYHFQTKEALIQAVLRRRLAPLNERRLKLFSDLQDKHKGGVVPLDSLLHALIWPVFEGREDGSVPPHFARILGRLFCEPGDLAAKMILPEMKDVLRVFIPAMLRSVRGMTPATLAWGMHLSIGCMAHTLAGESILRLAVPGVEPDMDARRVTQRIVQYSAAGIRALIDLEKRKS